jgi:hypothetical protein
MARARSLGLVALGALAALLLVAGASAASALFGGADVETLETPELSFDYPAEWRPIEGVEFPLAQAAGEGQVGENTVGLDPDNWVTAFTSDSGIVVFGKPQHNLGPLTKELGGREAVLREAVLAVPRNAMGKFEATKQLGRHRLTVGGRVVDGVPRIGTVFAPP